jgi:hypothetical protein
MPTTKPRLQVTETPELTAALDAVCAKTPDEPRSQVLARLALEGFTARQDSEIERRTARLLALHDLTTKFADCYPPGYLEELRRDWDGRP